jgi:hypothetical protein
MVRFQCDYNNTDANEVFQGPNAKTSEMCVFAGLYYPKQMSKFEHCHPYSVTGFGTQNCLETAACLQSCPASDAPQSTWTTVIVGDCWQRCIAAACGGAVDGSLAIFGCVGSQCATECAQGSGPCATCQSTKCGAEYSACGTMACPK